MSLDEFSFRIGKDTAYYEENVKEAIKKLKEELFVWINSTWMDEETGRMEAKDIIDKIFGRELCE